MDSEQRRCVGSESRGNGAAERDTAFMFARVGLHAASRLAQAVEAGTAPPAAMRLWFTVLGALPSHEQRLSRTQAEITREAGLAPHTARKAWDALIALGLVVNPKPVGSTLIWECAADAVTRLPEAERRAALQRQTKANQPRLVA